MFTTKVGKSFPVPHCNKLKTKKIGDKKQALSTPPKRSLGQNFLIDKNLAQWAVEAVGWQDGEWLVEIGPGRGALTGHLCENRRGKLLLIEKDRELAAQWRERLGKDDGAEVWEGDALDFDLRQLWRGHSVALLGNLPYNVATAVLSKFLGPDSPVQRGVFMVQKEVAERLVAKPWTKAYGALSVLLQREWEVRMLRVVPPEVFLPRPKVESALVEFRRRPCGEIVRCGQSDLERAVRAGFSQRRKQLHKLLPVAKAEWERIATDFGWLLTTRAEELDPVSWQRLAARLGRETDHNQRGEEEMFDEVDAQDRVLGARSRGEIHRLYLRHRAAHILLRNEAGEIFLQKRAPWKDINPGVWDSSAAGHVDSGEDYAACAHRELEEELGVNAQLAKIGKLEPCPATGNEFIEIYAGKHSGPFRCNELEITAGAFFSRNQIEEWLERAPDEFSPVFRLCWPILCGVL